MCDPPHGRPPGHRSEVNFLPTALGGAAIAIVFLLPHLWLPPPQFSGVVVAFRLGWLIAGPAGGVITYRFHQRSSETTRPMLVAAAGAVCAYSVPQMYAGLVILGVLWTGL